MSSPQSHHITLPGRSIHVLEWGLVDGPPLVLVHGIRDHAHGWAHVADAFAHTHRIIAPDLRGHGDSDWCDAYNLHDYLRDLAGVIEALGLSGIALVGHSMGGHIALRYTACFPERVSALCSIEGLEMPIMRDQRRSPRTYTQRLREWVDKEALRETRRPRAYAGLDEAKARMAQEHPRLDAETLDLIVRHGMKVGDGGFVWKYDNACRNRAPEDAHGRDVDELLEAITCPVLLAYGEESWIPVPPAARLARLAHYRLMTFPHAGHWLQHDARAPFLQALAAFLSNPDSFPHKETPSHA